MDNVFSKLDLNQILVTYYEFLLFFQTNINQNLEPRNNNEDMAIKVLKTFLSEILKLSGDKIWDNYKAATEANNINENNLKKWIQLLLRATKAGSNTNNTLTSLKLEDLNAANNTYNANMNQNQFNNTTMPTNANNFNTNLPTNNQINFNNNFNANVNCINNGQMQKNNSPSNNNTNLLNTVNEGKYPMTSNNLMNNAILNNTANNFPLTNMNNNSMNGLPIANLNKKFNDPSIMAKDEPSIISIPQDKAKTNSSVINSLNNNYTRFNSNNNLGKNITNFNAMNNNFIPVNNNANQMNNNFNQINNGINPVNNINQGPVNQIVPNTNIQPMNQTQLAKEENSTDPILKNIKNLNLTLGNENGILRESIYQKLVESLDSQKISILFLKDKLNEIDYKRIVDFINHRQILQNIENNLEVKPTNSSKESIYFR